MKNYSLIPLFKFMSARLMIGYCWKWKIGTRQHQNPWNYLVSKKIVDKTNNGENVSSFAVVEAVLVQCNFAYNQYQQNLEVLYTFTPNKSSH